MLPLLKRRAQALRVRIEGAAATLDLLKDCGMSEVREHEQSLMYLRARLASIECDIAILEQGYALKENRHASR